MHHKLLFPSLFLLLCIGCFVTAQLETRADNPEYETRALGRSWKKLGNSLDQAYESMQEGAGLKARPLVDDDVFLRRVYLDLTGAPPSPKEIRAFRPDRDDDPASARSQKKRAKLVKQLLDSPEFNEHMAEWLSIQLGGRPERVKKFWETKDSALEVYLRNALQENMPWDELVRGLFVDTPGNQFSIQWSFIKSLGRENDVGYIAGETSRLFLGRQVQCAQCHDHPYDPYTQDDFEAWQAFFKSFVGKKRIVDGTVLTMGKDLRFSSERDLSKKLNLEGEHELPRYLDGTEYDIRDGKNLRIAMANWLTDEDNAWFREMAVNRFMAYFLGVGFVDPVDDFNSFNTPTIPAILHIMGEDFAKSGFDVRYLIQAIVTSRLYQRTAGPGFEKATDTHYYSHQRVRELTPEMLERSILKVLDLENLNPGAHTLEITESVIQCRYRGEYPGDKSVELYEFRLRNLIQDAWSGEPTVRAAGERASNLTRALVMLNGDLLPDDGLDYSLKRILRDEHKTEDRVEQIFTTVLGRRPTEAELEKTIAHITDWAGEDDPTQAHYEDLFVALMCTTEFMNRT